MKIGSKELHISDFFLVNKKIKNRFWVDCLRFYT
jgi:hypothetical protein